MKSKPPLPPQVIEDIMRFQSYGWQPGIIGKLVRRKYGITVNATQLNNIKELICLKLTQNDQ